jgi:hypothetical protein
LRHWGPHIDLPYVQQLLEAKADLENNIVRLVILSRSHEISLDELKLYIQFDKKQILLKELLIRLGASFINRDKTYDKMKLLLSIINPNKKHRDGCTLFMNVLNEATERGMDDFEYMERIDLDIWDAHETNFRISNPIDYLTLYINKAQFANQNPDEVRKVAKFFVEKGVDPSRALQTHYKKGWEQVEPTQIKTLDDLYKKHKYSFLKNALIGIEEGLIERGYTSARELEKLDLPKPIVHDIASKASVGLLTSPRQKDAAKKKLTERLRAEGSAGGSRGG